MGYQGRIKSRNEALSNIALRIMHKAALDKEVPLQEIGKFLDTGLEQGFSISPDMLSHWNHYMSAVGNGARPLGQVFLAHMRLYFAWRFQRIHAQEMPDAAGIRQQEQIDAEEQARMRRELERLKKETDLAKSSWSMANQNYHETSRKRWEQAATQQDVDKAGVRADEAKRKWKEAEDRQNAHQAKLVNIPEPSLDKMGVYDRQLVKDAKLLREAVASRQYQGKPCAHTMRHCWRPMRPSSSVAPGCGIKRSSISLTATCMTRWRASPRMPRCPLTHGQSTWVRTRRFVMQMISCANRTPGWRRRLRLFRCWADVLANPMLNQSTRQLLEFVAGLRHRVGRRDTGAGPL